MTLTSLGEALRESVLFRRSSGNESQLVDDKVSPVYLRRSSGKKRVQIDEKKENNSTQVIENSEKESQPMDTEEWRKRGQQMVEYIAEYIDSISKRRVTPSVEPGYLKPLLPEAAPFKPEDWDQIMEDFEEYIMPGVTHWQHPRFHAYFPAGNSYPSILADMLTDAIGCIGFSWV